MTLRPVLCVAALTLVPSLALSNATAVECETRLEATLERMLSLPLLKEEQATGIMWLRMDAEEALEQGDEETCIALVEVVEGLLGMDRAGTD